MNYVIIFHNQFLALFLGSDKLHWVSDLVLRGSLGSSTLVLFSVYSLKVLRKTRINRRCLKSLHPSSKLNVS